MDLRLEYAFRGRWACAIAAEQIAAGDVCPLSSGVRCHLSTYRYAAYGSNLHPGRLQKRVPSANLCGTGFLPNHELHFHKSGRRDGSGKCNILEGTGGVYVSVFEIAESERNILDNCEGLGFGYLHKLIRVDGLGLCSTYIADRSAIDNTLSPFDWYKEYVLRGARFNRFPAAYVATLEAVVAVEDPDRARSEREWKLVEELGAGD